MSQHVLTRYFHHMRWANHKLFMQLSDLPEEALTTAAWNPEWKVNVIAHHIFVASGRLYSRITGEAFPDETPPPQTSEAMKSLAEKSYERDSRFLNILDVADDMRTFLRYDKEVQFRTSTILAQATHHASEHRAQIADILAINNMDVINLDALDLWSFERAEKKNP